jgi:hypothetical protein
MSTYTAHNLAFLDDYVPENDCCVIPNRLWTAWIQEQSDVLLVKITYQGKEQILHVHSYHSNDTKTIYIPRWCFSIDSSIDVTMERILEMPPVATKITLQPLDAEIYHCDISKEVSEHLANWQTLMEGTTITVECEELGGFPVDLFVKSIEPASTVLLRGDVVLELAEPLETVAEWVPPPAPPVPRPSTPSPSPGIEESFQPIIQKGFVPFSGQGHRLGGST